MSGMEQLTDYILLQERSKLNFFSQLLGNRFHLPGKGFRRNLTFQEIIVGSILQALFGVTEFIVGGQQDDVYGVVERANFAQQVDSVHPGHYNIGNDKLRMELPKEG